jgi:hypothetical protein
MSFKLVFFYGKNEITKAEASLRRVRQSKFDLEQKRSKA